MYCELNYCFVIPSKVLAVADLGQRLCFLFPASMRICVELFLLVSVLQL